VGIAFEPEFLRGVFESLRSGPFLFSAVQSRKDHKFCMMLALFLQVATEAVVGTFISLCAQHVSNRRLVKAERGQTHSWRATTNRRIGFEFAPFQLALLLSLPLHTRALQTFVFQEHIRTYNPLWECVCLSLWPVKKHPNCWVSCAPHRTIFAASLNHPTRNSFDPLGRKVDGFLSFAQATCKN